MSLLWNIFMLYIVDVATWLLAAKQDLGVGEEIKKWRVIILYSLLFLSLSTLSRLPIHALLNYSFSRHYEHPDLQVTTFHALITNGFLNLPHISSFEDKAYLCLLTWFHSIFHLTGRFLHLGQQRWQFLVTCTSKIFTISVTSIFGNFFLDNNVSPVYIFNSSLYIVWFILLSFISRWHLCFKRLPASSFHMWSHKL